MKITVTGHRPEKIVEGPIIVGKLFQETFLEAEPEVVNIGMAAGIDLIAGIAAIKTCFPVHAYVPWKGHKPRKGDEGDYDFVKHFAQKVIYVTDYDSYPGPWVYPKRNRAMVDNGTHVLAYWNGDEAGGTYDCVSYALTQDQKVRNLYGKRLG